MKELLIASLIGLGLASGSAFAADLPVIPVTAAPDFAPPVPPPPVYTWTGCYINGGAGYGLWKQDHYGEALTPLTQLTPTVSTGGEPWVGTVGAGCDYQAGSRWLIGAFGDYNLMSSVYGAIFQEPYTGWVGNETADGAWAAGGRIGYLVTPKLLTYISAGYTQAHFGQINLFTNTFVTPAACGAGPCYIPAHNDGGWFIGGGTEIALSDLIPVNGLFWRTDYRYAAYSGIDLPILTSTGAPVTCTGVACGEHMQKDYQTATTGLVWRFNVDGLPSGLYSAAAVPVTAGPGVGGASPSPPPSPPSHAWCYINGGAGYGMWEQDHYTDVGPTVTGSTGGEGWLGTAGVGCDYRVGSRWVIGVLADYDFMNMSGRFQDPFLGYIGTQTQSWAWAAGARVGYLVTPDFLTYINLGYPEEHFDKINLVTPSSAATPYYYPAHTYTSGFLFFGAGTEYALKDIVPLNGLFWRTEYRYSDYTDVTLPLMTTGSSPSACPHCGLAMAKDMQTITSGFVWRFYIGGL
jgi:outer membrane immunogenic protein